MGFVRGFPRKSDLYQGGSRCANSTKTEALENRWPGLPTVDGTSRSSSLLMRCTPATSLTGKVHLRVLRGRLVSEVTKSLSGSKNRSIIRWLDSSIVYHFSRSEAVSG